MRPDDHAILFMLARHGESSPAELRERQPSLTPNTLRDRIRILVDAGHVARTGRYSTARVAITQSGRAALKSEEELAA